MNYEKEIDQLFRELLFGYCDDEEQYQKLLNWFTVMQGVTMESLSEDIEKGLAMGISSYVYIKAAKEILSVEWKKFNSEWKYTFDR